MTALGIDTQNTTASSAEVSHGRPGASTGRSGWTWGSGRVIGSNLWVVGSEPMG
jgi:hypothetical protein